MTFDLMRAIPMSLLEVTVEVVRDGRRVQVVVASLLDRGTEVARATALRMRVAEIDLPPAPFDPWQPPPPPDETPPAEWADWEHNTDLKRFHRHAVEVRTVNRSFRTPGRGLSWVKLLYPVVAGEQVTPTVRAAALADVANGNAKVLDPAEYLYVNPDVTLYLHRDPVGDWIGMDSVAFQHGTGIGVADTLLFDTNGPIGRVNQAQLLERH